MTILVATTIAQLLVGTLANLTQRDPTQLNRGQELLAFGGINEALKDWFTTAGPVYTVDENSTEIYAPIQLTINVTADSNQFTVATGLPATGFANIAALVPQCIVIAGDGQLLNRVQSVNGSTGTLWRNYLGASGTVNATIYCDAVTFQQTDFEVVGSPTWTGTNVGPYTWPLEEWSNANPWLTDWAPAIPFVYYGVPLYFITGSHLPLSGVAAPYWYMRLWPLPGTKGNVSYKVKSMPPAYSYADLALQRQVPVPDEFIPLICTLAQRKMLTSPLWNKDISRDDVRADIQRAESELGYKLAAASTDNAPRLMGTPANF